MPAFYLTQGAAYIVITAITGIVYTLLVWSIRLFVRLKIHPPFAWDDIHCLIATLFTCANSSLILAQSAYGLGHPTSTIPANVANIQRVLGWVAVLCFLQATCFSILSVTFLLVRVTKQTSQARPAYLAAGLTVLATLTWTTIVLFQCRLPAPWRTRPHSRCIDIYSAWLFITLSRALIEVLNVVIAAHLLWKLRMPVRPKAIIIGMFALRLLVIPPALTRLHYLKVSWQAADWSYARINVQIISQVTLHVSTILATVPCVKNFLLVWESGNLQAPTTTTTGTTDENGINNTSGGGAARRVTKRRSSIYIPTQSTNTLRPPRPPPPSRRARSEIDLVQIPTSVRPGPKHRLRMNSWSAPGGLSTRTGGRETEEAAEPRTLATAEHDPEDAAEAAVQRRKSAGSDESRSRIKRTQSFAVDWVDFAGGGGGAAAAAGGQGRTDGEDGKVGERERRKGSLGSCWSSSERDYADGERR